MLPGSAMPSTSLTHPHISTANAGMTQSKLNDQAKPLEACLSAIESELRHKPTTRQQVRDSTSGGSAERSNTSALPDRARRALWETMGDIYGHRWASCYGSDPDGRTARTWAKGLADLGPEQLADGIRSCIKAADAWPPSLPEFRAMCLKIPSLQSVRSELSSRDAKRTQFAVLVWQHLDAHRWRHADARDSDRMLREAYDEAKGHVMAGGRLPDAPVAAIEQQQAPPPKPSDPETAKRHLAEMAAILNQREEYEDQTNRDA